MPLVASLSIAGPDGQVQPLFKQGAQAPAAARAVFATQKAGERSLVFKLHEGEGDSSASGARRLVGTFTAALPPGLPPNTWLAVHIAVDDSHRLRIEIKENLRRLRIEPECDPAGADATTYSA